ncbi:MAG: hypothetical protein EAZ08_13755 [Cytophagales bacterium]|nr:MAG: hypothetical protein EAZ08_13755 [Cytophagales bacterium]
MAIPKEILDDCKEFCEKLQKLVDWALISRFEEDYWEDEENDDGSHKEKYEVIDNIHRYDMYNVIFNINDEFDKNALKTLSPLNSMTKPTLFDGFYHIFFQIGHRQRFFE